MTRPAPPWPAILIAGDSYSDSTCVINGYDPTHTWIDLLRDDYEVTVVGAGGATNYEILHQCLEHKRPWHRSIISLAPLSRGGDVKQSIKAVRQLTKIKNAYVWTTFAEYRNIKDIDWQPFVSYNEIFNKMMYKDKQFCYTGCHFTREGNEAVAEHMKLIIGGNNE